LIFPAFPGLTIFFERIEPYHKEIALIDGESGREVNYDELRKNIYSVAAATV
jgi:hypothetical protein